MTPRPKGSAFTGCGQLGDVVANGWRSTRLTSKCASDNIERTLSFELGIGQHGISGWGGADIDSPHLRERVVCAEDVALRIIKDAAERRLLEHHSSQRLAPLGIFHSVMHGRSA